MLGNLVVGPWKRGSYSEFTKEVMNDWRKNPDDYGFNDDSLIMKGYTELWADYSLDQDETWWVGEYIITPFIFNRIKNEVKLQSGKKYIYEGTFDFINDNGEIYKGIETGSMGDGCGYYLKDEDFDKIKFPEIPVEVPEYVYLIYKLKTEVKEFKYEDPEDQIKVVNLKIGDRLKLSSGKIITVIDSDNGKISIVYKENSK